MCTAMLTPQCPPVVAVVAATRSTASGTGSRWPGVFEALLAPFFHSASTKPEQLTLTQRARQRPRSQSAASTADGPFPPVRQSVRQSILTVLCFIASPSRLFDLRLGHQCRSSAALFISRHQLFRRDARGCPDWSCTTCTRTRTQAHTHT